ncbi:HEAT repeat domain-containing protein, partial [bacterium]|nr:HEAT repeat domain-containing protein [bacterium]
MRHIRWTVVCSLALAACAFAGAANPTPKHLAVLNSDASMEKKAEACRLLAGGGDASAIPTLAKMLVDPKLSHMARYALEPMPFPEAGTALRNALSTLKGDLLLGAIHSVGMRKDEAAVTSLTRLLGAPETAAAAAMALGRIATPEAAKALAAFRKTAKDRMVVFAGDASLRAARGLVARGEPKLAAAICTELQAKSWPPHIRLGAFTCLLTADPAEAPARILQAVASDDPKLRATAIAQIPALKGKNVIAQFAAELPKSPPAVQALLLRALARRPDAKGALGPVVTQLIQSPDADVRRIAVQTLGAVGDAGSVPALCALLAKGEPAAATS